MIGSIMDPHLKTYSISYLRAGTVDWVDIVPSQSAVQFTGIFGTWDPQGLSGGAYQLKVTAKDALDQTTEILVNVTIAGANLNIDPAQITFSNSHPLPGDTIEVMVTVSNFGDSPAEDMTVTIYDGDKVIHTQTGVDIPANGIVVVTADLKVSGTHEITARATSDLYDSGSMSTPSVLEPAEEEMVLENFGGIFGLIALILALVAIVLVFVLRGKKEKKPKEEKVEEKKEEVIEEKKEEIKRAPPIDIPKKEEPKPTLPTAPAAEKPELPAPPTAPRPALPGPTFAPPASTPPTPPPSTPTPPTAKPPTTAQPPAGKTPELKPTPQSQAQLKAAPAGIAPVKQTPATYTPPEKNGQKAPEVQLPDL
jgi:hypothetical protein